MASTLKPRKRAVRLAPEALDALRRTLAERWQADAREGRLTWEARAELLGVSVATAKKILAGEGVDRASLAHAFKRLGLAWSDSCCAPVSEEAEETAEAQAPSDAPAEPPPQEEVPRKLVPAWTYALGGCALAVLVAFALVNRASTPRSQVAKPENWGNAFNAFLFDGIARYHRADYAGCRRDLDQALKLARKHDSAMHIAHVMHVEGDLEQEQGRLQEAKTRYQAELNIRKDLDDHPKAGIYEALGEVETRLGEIGPAGRDLGLSLEGFRRLEDPVGVAIVASDLGSWAFAAGRLDEADAWFGRSLAALKGRSKPDIVFDVRGRQALVLLKRGRANEALRDLDSCLAYWTKQGHPRWIALCELQLARAKAQLGDRAAATALLVRSRAGFEAVGDLARLAEATERLRRLASQRS